MAISVRVFEIVLITGGHIQVISLPLIKRKRAIFLPRALQQICNPKSKKI